MTLLNDWQKKKSWKESEPFYLLYRGKYSGFSDISLRNVLRKENDLELDLNSHTGFSNIEILPCTYDIGRYKYREITKMEKLDLNQICNTLNQLVKEYFEKTWDSKVFHLIFASGGHDSRIIMGTLKKMEKEGFDLGDYLFVCHEDLDPEEQILFVKSLESFGFDKSKYEIYKEGHGKEKDYFWFDEFSVDYNYFLGPLINHYDPIKINPLKTCLVTGTHIRSFSQINFTMDYYIRKIEMIKFSRDLIKWGDVICPFTYYDFLDYVHWIPPKFYGFHENKWFDLIRELMPKLLGNTLPFHVGHKYNLTFSDQTKKNMKESYYDSIFYNDYKIEINLEKDLGDIHKIDNKIYGLATVYEAI